MWLRAMAIVVLLASCKDPPPPVIVAVPPPVAAPPVPEPDPEPKVDLPPPPPESVAAFPEELADSEEIVTDEQLLRLLLTDPSKAEAALQKLEAPDAWQVEVIAQLALARGQKAFDAEAERALPPAAAESEVLLAPDAGWISRDSVELLSTAKKRGTLASLPINTKVTVKSFDGDWVSLSVPVAQTVIYGETGALPVNVVSTSLEGRVSSRDVSAAPYEVDRVIQSALNQRDDQEGRLISVSTWLLASKLERSERTREGLLRAAWTAKRAAIAVRAALARNLAPASGMRFAWSCTGEDPSTASWLDLTKRRPRELAASVCVSGLDARARCDDDTKAALDRAAATKRWLADVKLAPKPWLRFNVDARDPRQVFVVTTPLDVADPCSEFEEVAFKAANGEVRRLTLPLGTKAMTVWLPVSRHAGAEFSIPSTASEAQAISWLRSRGNYRWTVGSRGELQPSLGVNARAFEVSEDVTATSFALAPERDCSCE